MAEKAAQYQPAHRQYDGVYPFLSAYFLAEHLEPQPSDRSDFGKKSFLFLQEPDDDVHRSSHRQGYCQAAVSGVDGRVAGKQPWKNEKGKQRARHGGQYGDSEGERQIFWFESKNHSLQPIFHVGAKRNFQLRCRGQ